MFISCPLQTVNKNYFYFLTASNSKPASLKLILNIANEIQLIVIFIVYFNNIILSIMLVNLFVCRVNFVYVWALNMQKN